jgi:Na+-translocating ferredoxin:NAD+ oxidoreductase RnfD subunit
VTDQLKRFLRTPKGWLFVAFAALAAAAGSQAGWTAVGPHLVWAALGAAVVDLLAGRAAGYGWRWPSSALLSGLIVAFVLGLETPALVTAAVGALASASKYVFFNRRGHVFNPAGLALLLAIPLFATGQSWWGATADLPAAWTLLLLLVGVAIVDKVNKYPMALAFLASLYAVFTAVALRDPAATAELFRAPFVQSALFLAFFMLTDPPTSPGRVADQLWMGAMAGVVAAGAQLAGLGQAYLLVGLIAVNVALAVQRMAQGRRRATPGPAVGASTPPTSMLQQDVTLAA